MTTVLNPEETKIVAALKRSDFGACYMELCYLTKMKPEQVIPLCLEMRDKGMVKIVKTDDYNNIVVLRSHLC